MMIINNDDRVVRDYVDIWKLLLVFIMGDDVVEFVRSIMYIGNMYIC